MKENSLIDLLKGVSNSDTSTPSDTREQIEYIDIERIERDPSNFYKLTGLDELAANIEVVGLQQPLRVRTADDRPEQVVVVSGHRRLMALSRLIGEGRTDLRAVPCIRERSAGSAALQELRLIYANRDTRVISSGELARQAERVEMLLYQLKEEGFEFPGKMRGHVAQACKISAPKLARLKVIREKLIPEYMALFDKDKLPEQTAYALARLPEDFQQRMASALSEPPNGATAEKVLSKYNEGWRWEPQLTCPDGKVCKRGDAFLRRDCEAPGWSSFCGGNTCCLECDQAKASYSPCERMCSKAKALRKEARDKKKEAELERKRKNGRKHQKETQIFAKRLLKAIAPAMPDDIETIKWRGYRPAISVGTIKAWANGEFSAPEDWLEPELDPQRGGSIELAEIARRFHCSVDYLMGLTDDIRPVATQEEPEEVSEAPLESGADIPETLDQAAPPEERARRIRWEDRGRTPPMNKTILTYKMTNDGPEYRPAVWTGSKFKSPNRLKELTGLQYTHWLEVPLPGSGEVCQVDQVEGHLMFCGWIPGGTSPAETCDLVADFQVAEDTVIRQVCFYDGKNYRFDKGGAKIDAEVIRWMRLPPVYSDETVSNLDTKEE